jgi:hypothetical protein
VGEREGELGADFSSIVLPKADAKADTLQSLNFFLTLDVNTTHFNGLPSFSIFEIFRILSLPLLCCYK